VQKTGPEKYFYLNQFHTGKADILSLAPPIGTKVKAVSGSSVVTGLAAIRQLKHTYQFPMWGSFSCCNYFIYVE